MSNTPKDRFRKRNYKLKEIKVDPPTAVVVVEKEKVVEETVEQVVEESKDD